MPDYIIIKGVAPGLRKRNGTRTKLSFTLGQEKGHRLFLKVMKSSKGGTTGPQGSRIYLDALLDCIRKALRRTRNQALGKKGYFKRKDLKSAIRGKKKKDRNLPGFVVAVLIDIGIVEPANPKIKDGKYRLRQVLRKSPP